MTFFDLLQGLKERLLVLFLEILQKRKSFFIFYNSRDLNSGSPYKGEQVINLSYKLLARVSIFE